MRPPLILPPLNAAKPHTGTIIFSHGLGDSAEGWRSVAEQWRRRKGLEGVKWVLTNAPIQPVTVNQGHRMASWYDIPRPHAPASLEDTSGMLSSSASIQSLIRHEIEVEGVEEGRVIVGGFSQGGVLSLLAGLTSEFKLGGIVCLSGFLPLTHNDALLPLVTPAGRTTPLLWAHGTSDASILYAKAQFGREYLVAKVGRAQGKGFEFRAYEGMGHELGEEECEDVGEWLAGVFTKQE